jgi:hypothetical protein
MMMKAKAETMISASSRPVFSKKIGKTILQGGAVILALSVLPACERFRHEKYSCPSNSIGLMEVVINEDRAGAEASIAEIGRDYTMTIGSITSDELILANDEMVMIINRNTGYMQVTVGMVAKYIRCEKSLFTM